MEEMRWEGILGRESLRVLLAEPDHATREIVAALLRKCGYQVASASDGLKAWEVLKENQQEIDLVLMEVELPQLSGFELLTMIAESDTCRNIPVIMMSSHDYIGMVFKFMLKGAADFLVKPLRKNELRNLWQHVWRRYSMKCLSGQPDDKQDCNTAEQNHEPDIENDAASNTYGGYAACSKKRRECSDKGSDTQSSCTCPTRDAEDLYIHNMHENDELQLDGVFEDRRGLVAKVHSSEQRDSSTVRGDKAEGCSGMHDLYNARGESFDHIKPSIASSNFHAAMDEPNCSHKLDDMPKSKASSNPEVSTDAKLSSALELDLSLKLTESSEHTFSAINKQNILNHSNMSAFSRYNRKSTLYVPLATRNLQEENKDAFHKIQKPVEQQAQYECFHDPKNASQVDKSFSFNGEDTSSTLTTSSNQAEKSIQFQAPNNTSCLDPKIIGNSYTAFFPSAEFVISPQLGAPPWMTDASMKATPIQLSQSSLEFCKLEQGHIFENQRLMKAASNEQRQITSEEVAHPPPLYDSERSNTFDMGVSDETDKTVAKDATRSTIESPRYGPMTSFIGVDPNQIQRSIHREAALNKFRLKRKERCFEKKVRYHSRQKLAEQRPRVKGQFVRQGKCNIES